MANRLARRFWDVASADDAGGLLIRRLLPTAIVLPVVLAGLKIAGQRAGFFGSDLGTLLLVASWVIILSIVIFRIAVTLHRRQKQAEWTIEALKAGEQRLQAILDSTNSAISIKDKKGRFLFANSQFERIFHVSKDALQGKTAFDFLPREAADAGWTNAVKALFSGAPYEAEEVFPQGDGPHAYLSSKIPLQDASGQAYAVAEIYTDITELKRAKDLLQRTNEELETRVTERTWRLVKANEELRTEITQRLKAEVEQERVRSQFLQFAPPEYAQYVLSHPDDYWKHSEKKVMTVLFVDVRRFTPFAEHVSPEEALEALNEIFSSVVELVQRGGGVLNKLIGDGMLALFGNPTSDEKNAADAARVALKAREAVDALAQQRRAKGLEALRIGIGVNTGEVVAGCLGSKSRAEYSVFGTTVNLGSRLEKLAAPGEILMGPSAARLLGEGFKLRKKGRMNIIGLSQPVEVSELLS